MTVRHQKIVKTLIEAMPYIRRFRGTAVVLKYGGAAMTASRLQEQFAEDAVVLRLVGMKPVVVHGGGPQISTHMRLGMEPRFVDGQCATDKATLEVSKTVLVGKVNKEIVGLVNRRGGTAVGISGEDAEVSVAVLDLLAEADIPAVASVSPDASREAYSVSADTAAGELAAACSPRWRPCGGRWRPA
jgi:acetylglutamate kinase